MKEIRMIEKNSSMKPATNDFMIQVKSFINNLFPNTQLLSCYDLLYYTTVCIEYKLKICKIENVKPLVLKKSASDYTYSVCVAMW